jgi:hypothetical protein
LHFSANNPKIRTVSALSARPAGFFETLSLPQRVKPSDTYFEFKSNFQPNDYENVSFLAIRDVCPSYGLDARSFRRACGGRR